MVITHHLLMIAKSQLMKRWFQKHFGSYEQIVILVPKGDLASEGALSSELYMHPDITNVNSFVISMQLDPTKAAQYAAEFNSENYTRLIVYTTIREESDVMYDFQDDLVSITSSHYDDYICWNPSRQLLILGIPLLMISWWLPLFQWLQSLSS